MENGSANTRRSRRATTRNRTTTTGRWRATERTDSSQPVVVRSQHTPCATWGWRGAPPPRPRTEIRRDATPVRTRRRCGCCGTARRSMSAGRSRRPGAHGHPRPSTASRSSAPLRPSVTATADRAGSRLRASPKAGPRPRQTSVAHVPLRCRGEPDPPTAQQTDTEHLIRADLPDLDCVALPPPATPDVASGSDVEEVYCSVVKIAQHR